MKILDIYKEDHLEFIKKSNPSTKQKILDFFNLYERTKQDYQSYDIDYLYSKSNLKKDEIFFLDLSSGNYSSIPDRVLNFKNLLAIDLSDNPLTDTSNLKYLDKLEVVFFENCQLTNFPKEIFYLKNLTSINLNRNKISCIDSKIWCHKFLTGLNLSYNKLSDIPDDINKCVNLKGLYMSNNQFTFIPDSLFNLTSLHSLDLNDNPIKKIEKQIGNLKTLECLYLENSDIESIPSKIQSLKKLKSLIISSSYLTNISDAIGELTNLNNLTIRGKKISNISTQISKLKKLKSLDISCNLEVIPCIWGELEKLESLSISGNKQSSLSNIKCNSKGLKSIDFNNIHLSDFPGVFSICENLERLALSNIEINEITKDIGKLQQLKSIYIWDCNITKLPVQIGSLRNLQSLYLNNNKLKELPLELSNLIKLTSLSLNKNPLTNMPEVKGMGIDELFRYFNKLRGIGDYSFIWELPEGIRTAFQQYLCFFSEFFEQLKGKKIEIEINKIENGLKINIFPDGLTTIDEINEYLKIYLEYAKNNVSSIFTSDKQSIEEELLILKLEMQVNHLQQQLKQSQFENKYLKNTFDKFIEIQLLRAKNPETKKLSIPDENSMKERLKKLIGKNEVKEVIEALLRTTKEVSEDLYNEVILAHSKFSRIELEHKIGVIDQQTCELNRVKLNDLLLTIIDKLEYNNA